MKARVEGFIVIEFKDRFPEAQKQIFPWVRQCKIHPLKTVWVAKFEELSQARDGQIVERRECRKVSCGGYLRVGWRILGRKQNFCVIFDDPALSRLS